MDAGYSQRSLLDQASQAQANARARSQFNSDTILVSKRSSSFQSPCGVHLLKHDQMRVDLTRKIAARKSEVGAGEKEGARMTLQVFSAQSSSCVTQFRIDRINSEELLPGGVPIIDHIAAYTYSNAGFSELNETIELIRNSRVPSVENPSQEVQVKELVLGVSSAEDMRATAKWIQERKTETKNRFNGLLVCAADTEDIAVISDPAVYNIDSLINTFREDPGPFRFRQFPAPPESKLISCPVLFMFGSVGWQVHIRVNVKYHITNDRTDVVFHGGELPAEEYLEVLDAMGPAVGTGITSDYSLFFRVIGALYGDGSKPRGHPVEMERLAKIAGADHPHTGVVSLVWLWLGGVLPKHYKCSIGDGKWGRPFQDLPTGLQLYLISDIQQVVRVAMVMLLAQALHLFPDPTLAYRTTGMSGSRFIVYWAKEVFQLLADRPSDWDRLPHNGTRFSSREALLEGIGIPMGREYNILRLCPGWPAITNGGPRAFQVVNSWFRDHYHILREHDVRTVPPHSPQELQALTTHEVGPPVVPEPAVVGPPDAPAVN